MSKSIYIVYETTNLINGKYYIGVHRKDGSGYLGSGDLIKAAIEKYGRKNFIREILREFVVEQNAYDYEKLIVGFDLIKNRNCYNIVEGGGNPPSNLGKKFSEDHKEKLSKIKKGNCFNSFIWYIHGKKFKSSREAAKFFDIHMGTILNWCNKNKPHCYKVKKEFIKKMKLPQIGKNHYVWGKKHTDESKKKMSKSAEDRGSNSSKMCYVKGYLFYSMREAAIFLMYLILQ